MSMFTIRALCAFGAAVNLMAALYAHGEPFAIINWGTALWVGLMTLAPWD